MKLLSAEQQRAADAYTIQNEPIDSIDLMERASETFVEAMLSLPLNKTAIKVVCGVGNNGGDGMAIARHLHARNFDVEVWALQLGIGSDDFKTNQQHWSLLGRSVNIEQLEDLPEIDPDYIIVDALYGSGINRPITGLAAQVIERINHSQALVVAVDMPSGLYVDQPNAADDPVIKAHYTLSFQNPKLAFLLPQNHTYVGKWQILDIGLSTEFLREAVVKRYTLDEKFLQTFKREPSKFTHKGDFGHALLVAGSEGKFGAAVLAARAALRCGLGLLTVHLPRGGHQIMQGSVPEAMVQLDQKEDVCSEIILSPRNTCAGLGPGLGTHQLTVKALRSFLETVSFPLVVDADALNIISQNRELLEILPPNSILTPHPKEFSRLMGIFKNDYHRLDLQQELAVRHRLVVVYKGAHSTIALPDESLYFNTTGNPGMSTGGTGDVLTGMVLGILSRTQDSVAAALTGVYLHGLAGDLAAQEYGMVAMTASDIITQIGPAFKKLDLLL